MQYRAGPLAGDSPPRLEPLEPRLLLSGAALISEFMALNASALADGDGNFEDWIEIHNPGAAAVNLDGWFLTDDLSERTRWRFPAVTVDPGQYLVVFASGKEVSDYVDAGGNLHTNFRLDAAGETVALTRPDGVTVAHAYEDYPEQLPDVSYGITGFSTEQQTLVAGDDAVTYHVPTAGEDPRAWAAPGFNDDAWTDTIAVDAAGVLVTEIATGDTRFVEIQNVSDQAANTAGWTVLVNNASGGINAVNAEAWSLPASVAAGEVLYQTDAPADHYWGAAIDWDAEGPGWAMVLDESGEVMDFVVWGYSVSEIGALNVSYGGFTNITVGDHWSGGGAAPGTTGGGPATGGFVAFNDHVSGAGTHADATTYSANGTGSGFLKDIDTGAYTDVTLNVTQNGTSYEGIQGVPAVGTDAYDIFNGYVDFGSGSGASLAISGGDEYVYTFSGLETAGGVTYGFTGTAVRGNTGYANRWTLVTLQGAVTATADHSSGVGVVTQAENPSLGANQVALWTGENHQAGQGFVACWTDIDPGADGTFWVVSTQYTGSTPGVGSGTADGSKGYGVTGIRLEEVAPAGPQSWLTRTGDADGDTAGDFVRSTSDSKGTQNPEMTVPFGTEVPAGLGIGFSDSQPAFDSLIRTDVGDEMQGTNASLWVRIEFEGGDLAACDSLLLRMKYDDGFIAYLNDTEVARRNADNPVAWNTAASAEHPDAQAVVFEDIDISAWIGSLQPGSNLLAIHCQNLGAGDADLLIVPELIVSGTSYDDQPKWFTSPTPRAANIGGGGFPGIVINEIHYDPDVRTQLVEFIELYNGGPDAVDLSGWYFEAGVEYVFPAGTTIASHGYVVVAQNPTHFQAKFGTTALGPWNGLLDGEGEEIVLRNGLGQRVDQVDYRRGFPWPTVGDEPGYSIELVSPSLDNDLGGSWRPSFPRPTPGAQNSAYASDANAAPQMRQVSHLPKQPVSGEDVTVTVKVTDPNGVESVTLAYQLVEPGDYISIDDARYNNAAYWTTVPMHDDGLGGDAEAGDHVYTVVLPGALQINRRLVRYRITATDSSDDGLSRTAPYDDDPQPNFAYFVYDGVPSWTGSAQPGVLPEVEYTSEVLTSVPVYHFITQRQDHLNAMYVPYRWGQVGQQQPTSSPYGGSEYRWDGALVYDGEVYDHIRYRARGGVWRYAMGKNMWKFDFNRGHSFQAKDDYGREYDITWDKLNFSACIQQGNYLHRGEQGVFEAAAFKMFNLAGVEAPMTHWAHFRLITGADENGPDQFSGDFQGLYMAMEQMDGRFLDEHGLPDGNLYKIEGNNAQLPKNNQGPTAVSDTSDFGALKSGYYYDPDPTEQWWRDNVDLEKYYSYRAVVEGVHHGDIAYGKNYFFYLNPETGIWSMLPWDVDLTWANNMYGNGEDAFRNQGRILSNPALDLEFKNRLREFEDLLYNPEQMYMLLDEMAAIIDDPGGGSSIVDADRAMWDYNPLMVSSYVNLSKAGHGRFYQQAATHDFPGMIRIMKNYVVSPNREFATNTSDPDLPNTPTITYVGEAGCPVNRLTFQASPFSDSSGSFAAMEWRIAEVADPAAPAYDPDAPPMFEITAAWESGEITTFDELMTIPPQNVEPGHAYRARVRMKDSTGRWSRWSAPVQFIAGESNETELTRSLRVTEIMYNPSLLPPGGAYDDDEFEFIELRNTGTQTLDISGVSFTEGITFSFAGSGVTGLAPGEFVVVAKNLVAFESRYDMAGMKLVGGYPDNLSDGGELIRLEDISDGLIQKFIYDDGWYPITDGDGFSLTTVDERAARDQWNNADNWQPSMFVHGTPGTDNTGIVPGAVVINEVLAHSDVYPNDWIELHNTTGEAIDIGGWFLSDSSDELTKYEIAAGTQIDGHGYIVFTENDNFGLDQFGQPTGDSGVRVPFALSELGDEVHLTSGSDGLPGGYRVDVDFGASPNAKSFGLYVDSLGKTDFTLLSDPTFGAVNDPPFVRDLVINEVMYHPADPTPEEIAAGFTLDEDFEYVELHNRSGSPIDLTEFWLSGAIGFTFGWYDTDSLATGLWTLESGATATWAANLPQTDTYEVFVYVSNDDLNGGRLNLDAAAVYRIFHSGGPSTVVLDQNLLAGNWASLGTFPLDAGEATVTLTRGLAEPDQRTIADRIKFVRTGQEVVADNSDLSFQTTGTGLTTLQPGGYVVIASSYAAFDERYDMVGNNIPVAGQYTGRLDNDGETVRLRQADTPEPVSGHIPYVRIDKLEYDDVAPWPVEADGGNSSLSRQVAEDYGNDVANWGASIPGGTPGSLNIHIDTSPPSVPSGLDGTIVSHTRIDLTWDPSVDNQTCVDHYIVYRNEQPLDTTTAPEYHDTDVTATILYRYKITAVNRDGYESAPSGTLSIMIPGIQYILAPDDRTVIAVFSEPVTSDSAETAVNYSLTGAMVTAASLDPDGVTVMLTTSALQINTGYTLTVNNVETVSGNVIPPGLARFFIFHPEGSGTVLREYWTGIAGSEIGDLTGQPNYPDSPSGDDYPTAFEAPINWADSYGTRIRGYVHPPLTGQYVFWIAADNTGQLFLSTDENPANKVLIASVSDKTDPREWDKYASQQSQSVYLENGQRYYIE
ncbi:MAG: lamin tail domain-containing protein, partial [Phycisphaerae bacterium]